MEQTRFYQAILDGDLAEVETLLESNNDDDIHIRGINGQTFLHLHVAVEYDVSTDIIKRLVCHIDISLLDENRDSVLDLILSKGADELREIIYDHIRNLVFKGDVKPLEDLALNGWPAWPEGVATAEGISPKIKDFFIQLPYYQNKVEEIHKAANDGLVREMQQLVNRKFLLIAKDQQDDVRDTFQLEHTALHYAAALRDGGHVYKILLRAGADESLPDLAGNTPSMYLDNPELMNVDELRQQLSAFLEQRISKPNYSKFPTFKPRPPSGSKDRDGMTRAGSGMRRDSQTSIQSAMSGGSGNGDLESIAGSRPKSGSKEISGSEEKIGSRPQSVSKKKSGSRPQSGPKEQFESRPQSRSKEQTGSRPQSGSQEPSGSRPGSKNKDSTKNGTEAEESSLSGNVTFKETTLYQAIISKNLDKVVEVVDREEEDISMMDPEDGSTYLHLAVECEAGMDIIRELLPRTDITQKNKDGHTALDRAILCQIRSTAVTSAKSSNLTVMASRGAITDSGITDTSLTSLQSQESPVRTNIVGQILQYVSTIIKNGERDVLDKWSLHGWNKWPKDVVTHEAVSDEVRQFFVILQEFQAHVYQIYMRFWGETRLSSRNTQWGSVSWWWDMFLGVMGVTHMFKII